MANETKSFSDSSLANRQLLSSTKKILTNSLDPDQDGQNVGSGLGSKCLTL